MQPIQEKREEGSDFNSSYSDESTDKMPGSEFGGTSRMGRESSDDEFLSSVFGHGLLREESIFINYLPRKASNIDAANRMPSGKSLGDFVARQASGLGLDPEIFINNDAMKQASIGAMSQVGKSTSFRNVFDTSAQSHHEIHAPEVMEIAQILNLYKTKSVSALNNMKLKKM